MSVETISLKEIADYFGIEPEYQDVFGKPHSTSEKTYLSLLKAMGLQAQNLESLQESYRTFLQRQWLRCLEPVCVVSRKDLPAHIHINLPASAEELSFEWRLIEESGKEYHGHFKPATLEHVDSELVNEQPVRRYSFNLPIVPELGYHTFKISGKIHKEPLEASMALVITPERCYMPPGLIEEGKVQRTWGPTVQLYAVRSRRNWGMGDFTDLGHVLEQSFREGAGVVGVNPLHALFPNSPEDASPYSPSSRNFLNILYLDIEAIPEFQESEEARRRVFSPAFQQKLDELREAPLVNYDGVAALKLEVLEKLYQHFREVHLETNSPRAQAFWWFVHERGEPLETFALYEALQERFQKDDPTVWGWPTWPKVYRTPDSPAVKKFLQTNRERVEYFQYLQWLADEQLAGVGLKSFNLGLPVGLYGDLAVGVSCGGADTWRNAGLYALNVGVGAPPDVCNLKGQNWGLPPMVPYKLYDLGYQPFIQTLRENMRYMGALRIDHFMGLLRLFWIPPHISISRGAYVRYPLADLLGILALESHRNQCLIVGEDLGTVPPIIPIKMREKGILSYKLFCFEKQADGEFIQPSAYPQEALVSFSTHDLPTMTGLWQGQGIHVRDHLHMIPSKVARKRLVHERVMDRMGMLAALDREGILPEEITTDPASVPVMTPELINALHATMARTPSLLNLVQFEDVLEQLDQVNLPGTTDEYPNWRRKLSVNLEDLFSDERVSTVFGTVRRERGSSLRRMRGKGLPGGVVPDLDIPRATYRLQFNKDFTFQDALRLVPYLKDLGVSHCYASPILAARPGSRHGYDIIDHSRINPELGTPEDLDTLIAALKENGMGLILDIVPNHMGVGKENRWWMDVLEDGPASVYAGYFDIDWSPVKDELFGKVLLPVLGDQYGQILCNGELRLNFCPQEGRLSLHYYEHEWPINPCSYPMVFNHRIDVLEARLGTTTPEFLEYLSIVTAFERLPSHMDCEPARMAERRREKGIAFRRLASLCQQTATISDFIQENIDDYNDVKDNLLNRDRLHRLLEAQVYRLAYWRVALDEINYRRFFDVNDLAGLCMEDPQVFWDSHQLIIDLVAQRKVTGLRIDHPDGLFDPAGYFRRLQEEVAKRHSAFTPVSLESTDPLYLYVLVEKILPLYERLPEHWLVHGTTGYEFANALNGLLVDKKNEAIFQEIYQTFVGQKLDFNETVYESKRLIMKMSLSSELNVLAHRLNLLSEQDWRSRDFPLNKLRSALLEVVACFPVYRTYITQDEISKRDREFIEWAIKAAKKRSMIEDLSVFDFIAGVLLLQHGQDRSREYQQAVMNFTMKFQQFTGPVMAKGMEDTTFYRINPLVSLNEVGGEPQHFGITVAGFHYQNQERLKRLPHNMLTTSTHDTKRSEDVRARINVLSEVPELWQTYLTRWDRLNRLKRTEVDGAPAPDPNDEYFLYQTLLGVWPMESLTEEELPAFCERVEQYMLKAVREAKVHTSWVNQNVEYEEGLLKFIRHLLGTFKNNSFLEDFLPFQQEIAWFGMLNALTQVILKLTVPGVPDIYRGNEMWDFSLVDPDNRRPVDFAKRVKWLDVMDAILKAPTSAETIPERCAVVQDLLEHYPDGRIKLFVSATCLKARKAYPDLFKDGDYQPLEVTGESEDHVVAFARRLEDDYCWVVVPRLMSRLMDHQRTLPLGAPIWTDTRVILPENAPGGFVQNVLTGEVFDLRQQTELPLAELFATAPMAVLLPAP